MSIEIYTVSGEKVKSLVPVSQPMGNNERFWDATNETGSKVASGVYPYRIIARSPAGEEEFVWDKLAIMR